MFFFRLFFFVCKKKQSKRKLVVHEGLAGRGEGRCIVVAGSPVSHDGARNLARCRRGFLPKTRFLVGLEARGYRF